MQINGFYFEANKSQRHDVLLLLTHNNMLTIKAKQAVNHSFYQNVCLSDIEISPRIADTPRTFTFADGSVFETGENDQVDQWLKEQNSDNPLGWIHHLESRISYVLTTLIFVALFSWGFIQYGVPSLAASIAKVLPVEVNQYLGKGTLALLDKSYFTPSEMTQEKQAELRKKFTTYSDGYENLNINVVFRHGGSIGANAFALPDGHIVFTDEMVELSQDDLELIAIFGHEIGHLDQRHLLRRVIQDSLLASLVVLVTGDISYASAVVIALPVLLLEFAYSRNFEQEADQFALGFLNKNEIPTQHFAHIMLRLTEQEQQDEGSKKEKDTGPMDAVTEYLSTHPVTQERIQPFLAQ